MTTNMARMELGWCGSRRINKWRRWIVLDIELRMYFALVCNTKFSLVEKKAVELRNDGGSRRRVSSATAAAPSRPQLQANLNGKMAAAVDECPLPLQQRQQGHNCRPI